MPNPSTSHRRARARATCLCLALLATASLAVGCVSTRAAVPQQDIRATEQDTVADAAREVLREAGYVIERDDGRFLQSAWRGDDSQRERIHVRISDTSMGVALATRITTALPVPAGEAPADSDASIVIIEQAPWRIASERTDAVRERESRIARDIQVRWRELRRAVVAAQPPAP